MHFCVFRCEFIDLVGFFGCYCLTPVTLFINTKLHELRTPVVSVKSYSPSKKTSLSRMTGQGCFQAVLTLSIFEIPF